MLRRQPKAPTRQHRMQRQKPHGPPATPKRKQAKRPKTPVKLSTTSSTADLPANNRPDSRDRVQRAITTVFITENSCVNSVIKDVTISCASAAYGTRRNRLGKALITNRILTLIFLKITSINNLLTPPIITSVSIAGVNTVIKMLRYPVRPAVYGTRCHRLGKAPLLSRRNTLASNPIRVLSGHISSG